MSLTQQRSAYKPFQYPWAYDYWKVQQQVHWLPEEVPLADDVRDWHNKLTEAEQHLVTQIFRFFTQSDIEVNDCYMSHYSRVFKPTEVKMMLAAFSNMETIHIAAYSHLLDTIGMPEIEYSAFLRYKEMRDKHDFLASFDPQTPFEMAKTMAVFSAFMEGVALFASFAILQNFPRHGKLKGMGQIVTWSVRDETLHCLGVVKLWHTFLEEHPEIDRVQLKKEILEAGLQILAHEDAFIDLAFEMGGVEGMNAEDPKQYIRYIFDHRLKMLGMDPIFNIKDNPLPWMDVMMSSVEHANFFENRATEYSRAATEGEWGSVWDDYDRAQYARTNVVAMAGE